MTILRSLACTVFLLAAATVSASDFGADPARVFGDPALLRADDALGRLAVAVARTDESAIEGALGDRHLPSYLQEWQRGRRLHAEGRFEEAALALAEARESWRRVVPAAQPDLAADMLDHARALAVLRLDDRDRLVAIVTDPIGLHRDDSVWRALRALASPKQAERLDGLDAAWQTASKQERRHPVFARRALLHARSAKASSAADAWLTHAENLRSSEQRREAMELWDAEEQLRGVVEVGGDRPRLVRWLALMARREEALGVARRGVTSAAEGESARCFALVAEQLYSLRRHDELRAWLDGEWPAGLGGEERASLDAYPWGVRRREVPANPETARGFDAVVEAHAGTKRAIEALWEAAWMWELSGHVEEAEARYLRYATEAPGGPFAPAAAARSIILAARRGDHQLAHERVVRLRSVSGNSHDRAGALWAAWQSALAAGDTVVAAELRGQLEAEDAAGPFVLTPPHPLSDVDGLPSVDILLDQLFALQERAFEQLAAVLGIDADSPQINAPLVAIAWLYRHAFLEEGDQHLASYAFRHRGNSRIQLACVRLAWSMGRAEQQARIAWTLWLRENGRSQEIDRVLELVAFPTPFARDVFRVAHDEGVPAGLIYSVMRRESFFDPAVLSHAGAYGLLQLMPQTAERLASELGDPRPEPRQLWQPLLNLRYGVHYLRNLLEESQNDVYYALAAYNAGEGNGARWAARRDPGEDPASMLLLISYNETRAYVYHLLRYWRIYARFHAALGHPEASPGR
jgi:hypothetical protein